MKRESQLRWLIALGIAAIAATGQAQAQSARQAEMGRLFFTPAQRAQLDVARAQRARTTLATDRTEEATVAQQAPQTITYDGVVRSSDGKSTVFINSRPISEKDAASGPVIVGRVRADGGVSLQIPQSGRAVELKPGQSIELLSGTIEERYARKPVEPQPAPAGKPAADAKPATRQSPAAAPSGESARQERAREEREQQRVDDAVARVLRDSAGAKPAAPSSEPPAPPAR